MRQFKLNLFTNVGIHILLGFVSTLAFSSLMPAFVYNSFLPFLGVVLISGLAALIYELVSRLDIFRFDDF
jgi:hypothetical protein